MTQDLKRRIINTITIILLTTGLGFIFWKKEIGYDEIYFLPENYQGAVYVLFDQKSGTAAKLDNGKRVYTIPDNGILKTQFPTNKGWHSVMYFRKSGKQLAILDYVATAKQLSKDTVQACCLVFENSANKTKSDIYYDLFYIGTRTAIDSSLLSMHKVSIAEYAE
jgi:hypothetical protein